MVSRASHPGLRAVAASGLGVLQGPGLHGPRSIRPRQEKGSGPPSGALLSGMQAEIGVISSPAWPCAPYKRLLERNRHHGLHFARFLCVGLDAGVLRGDESDQGSAAKGSSKGNKVSRSLSDAFQWQQSSLQFRPHLSNRDGLGVKRLLSTPRTSRGSGPVWS